MNFPIGAHPGTPRLFATIGLCALSGLLPLVALAAETEFKKDPRPPVDPTKEKALYVVAYAHLDTQWRWTYPQVIREFIPNTLRQNFILIDKYPNYIFNFSGSRRHEMMREYYPQEYEKMKQLVAAGRWFPCGSSVDEGDSVVPSLESMVRHVLYGNRFFQGEFNLESQEFMLPDCFGFPASLPSVLSHCGIKGFSTQKLTWGSAVGVPFKVGNWIGPDGSRILAALDPGSYGSKVTEDLSQSKSWLNRITKTGSTCGAYVDYHYYGTGDVGGAPTDDSVKWIEKGIAGKGPVRVIGSKADEMFKAITPDQQERLPSYQGDLLLTNHSAGSITSQAYMKRWNRKSELLADSAERAAVAALSLEGTAYPSKKLYDAWDLVLGSQMHDMLPGTSIPKAYEYCWNDYLLAQNQFAAVLSDAITTVSSGLDTTTEGAALVVYNSLSIPRDDLVEAEVNFPGQAPESILVTGPDGNPVPCQIISRDGNLAKVVFLAHVPPVGFASYSVVTSSSGSAGALKISASERTLENARYRVRINEAGDIASVFDKAHSKELLSAPARLAFHTERPEQYPAWNMDWKDRKKPARTFVGGPAKVRIAESGAARVALEIERVGEGSRFTQQVRLGAGSDRVEVIHRIDWLTAASSLKATFPLAVSNPLATYDDKVGTVQRGSNDPKKFEVPQQKWFDLTDADGKYGVAVLNESKYGSDKPDDNTMRLTLLYTPGVRNVYQDEASQDFGRHDIGYAIVGHAGSWNQTGIQWEGARFNQPLMAYQTSAHPGKLGRSFGLFTLNSNQVEVAAIKKAEEGQEIIVRLRELNGETAKSIVLSSPVSILSAREVDGQERSRGESTLKEGKLVTDLPAYGLRAFALKLASPRSAAENSSRPQVVGLEYNLDAFSTDSNRADGAFDNQGRTFPAEQIPAEVVSEGIPFRMGPKEEGAKNVVVCRGQTIQLPGDYNKVYFLAAAVHGDTTGEFTLGDKQHKRLIQDWGGYIGQWDNRLWKGQVPESAYAWKNALEGLVPGYVKQDVVAWYASHRHHPKTGTGFYEYCYLFQYEFPIEPGAKSLTLPKNENIRLFAMTVANDRRAPVRATRPLYDDLADHVAMAPWFSPVPGKFSDITPVTVSSLYWKEGTVHYTVDGSEPTAKSPVYSTPLLLDQKTIVRARVIRPDGKPGPEGQGLFEVHDMTPPAVLRVENLIPATKVQVEFSKPLARKGAESVANYIFNPPLKVTEARISEDGKRVSLTLDQPAAGTLTVKGVADRSPQANLIEPKAQPVIGLKQLWVLPSASCDGQTSQKLNVEGLPVNKEDPWTINCFVKTEEQPPNRTLIAGFGTPVDQAGKGRFLAKFSNGIHFWSSRGDGDTRTQLDIGKWQMLTASYDGQTVTIYKNAETIGDTELAFQADQAAVHLAPLDPWDKKRRFKGEIRQFSIWNQPVPVEGLRELLKQMPK